MQRFKLGFVVFFSIIYFASFAQKSGFYYDSEIEFKNGIELFDKKLYSAAQKSFLNIISSVKNKKSLVRIDAEFYAAACALEMFHKDGEWRFRKFVEEQPESNKIKWAFFYLGKSNFRKKKYEEVIKWLAQVEVYDLNNEDLAELYFKRGYSYLEVGNFANAKLDFYEIKDVDNKYARPANYYYSHIAYLEKKYETAIEGFRRLLHDETFGPVVPFYISQIYFIQNKLDSVIKLAPILLSDTLKILRQSEISKIIGESFYREKRYSEALPYLKNYGTVTQDDNYEMAFALYSVGNKLEALSFFEVATSGSDTISQSAWYHLADCQLSNNEKSKARNSFYSAYKIGPNQNVREDALYSFAKLSYELDYTPYNEAITAFSEYINKYPNSKRRDEAYRYLVNVFASTQNYLEAMSAIQKIKNPEPTLKTLYQRMLWNCGTQWYNREENDSALCYFNLALKNNYDSKISALSTFWIAEIKYRKKDYVGALENLKQFQLMSGALYTKEFELAHYSMGYCYFNEKDYANANISFRKFASNAKQTDNEKMADAIGRVADSYFMNKDFQGAADNYEHAIAIGNKDIDYCIYQKSICNGILKNYSEKINDLKMLSDKYPNSEYIKGSVLEIAKAYIQKKEYENAINYCSKFLEKFPGSGQENEVKAQIGVLYMDLNNNEKALEYFFPLVAKDSKSSEAQTTAIPNIKNILLLAGKTEDWENFCLKYGIIVDKNELEEVNYETAKNLFVVKQDCDKSILECEKYMNKYPNGTHLQEVTFWFSECTFSKDLFDKALTGYLFMLSKPVNSYTEKSLLKASYIYFKNQQYEQALPLYIQLETIATDGDNKFNSKINAMRCAWNAKKYDTASQQASLVLKSERLSKELELEARKIRAQSSFELGKLNESLDDFKFMSKNSASIEGAKAWYYIANIQLADKKYKDVEKSIDKLMGYKYSDKFWMTKGLLLMSDCYIEQKKYSDAEAILNTIINNQVEDSFKEEALHKLEILKTMQTERLQIDSDKKSDKGNNVEFKNTTGNKDLFEILPEVNQTDTTKKENLNTQIPK